MSGWRYTAKGEFPENGQKVLAYYNKTNSWEEWQRWQIVTYHIPRKGKPYFGVNYEMPVAWMPLVEPEVA